MVIKSWSELIDAILLRKVAFVVTFFVVFISSYGLLTWLDYLPEPVSALSEATAERIVLDLPPVESQATTSTPVEVVAEPVPQEEEYAAILPVSLTIPSLNKTVNVLNPTSREVADLDEALLSGVVRHPDSAALNQKGTVFILGHSSYLPVVNNKNFQAFNGIQDLKWGDTIVVTAGTTEYVYRVDKVYRARAEDVEVPIAGTTEKLFLATCNSFGSTDDRYVVEADLIEVRTSQD